MKTLKDFLEVYKPKSPDEQKFVDKHVTIKHKDRNGNGDDVFNGNTKTIKRKEERHGYDAGEDEKVYEELELGEEIEFEFSEDVEELEEGTVGYKNYTITARANKSGQRELGDIKHVYGHEKKMNKLGVKQNDDDDKYGDTHHVTVKNNETGDVTHHHVYQSYGKDSTGKPTLSIRGVGKPHEQHSKHANVIAHYLSGKTKIKEDIDDLAFFDELLEMNLDEDTFTDASLAQLRVMKHKQEMKKIESSSKLHPLMKVRRLSDAKKKLADLEAARDHYVAKHEKAEAKKKKVTEEVELDEGASRSFGSAIKKAEASRQKAIKRAGRSVHKGQSVENAIRDHDLFAKDKDAVLAHAASLKRVAEEVEIEEKHLTPAEMKKREEVVKAIKRGNPKMDKSMAYAIATKTAKRVAEGTMPTADEPSEHDKKMAQKVRDLLAKEKKPVKEEVEELGEGIATYDKKGKLVGNYKDLETAKKLKPGHHYAPKGTVLAALDRVGKPVWAPTFKEEVEDLDESAKIAAHLIKRYGDNVRKSHVRSAANDFGVGYVALAHAVRKKLGVNRLEEEQIDEISSKTLSSYSKKAKKEAEVSNDPMHRYSGRLMASKKTNPARGGYKLTKVAATFGEEVDELDELSKATLGSYINKAQGSTLGQGMKMQREVERGASDSARKNTARKVTNRFQGVSRAVDRLTKEDIINRAIANYMPEDAEPYTLEDRLLDKIEHIPESHAATLLVLFNELSEENQKTMLETVETQEGINSLLDFAINNRGE